MKNKLPLWAAVKFFSVLILMLHFIPSFCQIVTNETPVSFNVSASNLKRYHSKEQIPTIELPQIDTVAIAASDRARNEKNLPFRFGYPFLTNITMDNSRVWDTLLTEIECGV